MDGQKKPKRRNRFISSLGLGTLFFGVVAGLSKDWISYWLGPARIVQTAFEDPDAAAKKQGPQTIDDLLRSSPVALSQWQTQSEQFYSSQAARERTFREHLGKKVVWEGYFDKFNVLPQSEERDASCLLIMQESLAALTPEQPLGPPFIRCWLPESAQKQVASLKRGEWIVIRGRISDPLLAGSVLCTDLTECELVVSSPLRNVELAVGSSGEQTVIR